MIAVVPNPARPAMDQQRFARLQPRPLEDIVPNREEGPPGASQPGPCRGLPAPAGSNPRRRRNIARIPRRPHLSGGHAVADPVSRGIPDRSPPPSARNLETRNFGRAGRRRIDALTFAPRPGLFTPAAWDTHQDLSRGPVAGPIRNGPQGGSRGPKPSHLDDCHGRRKSRRSSCRRSCVWLPLCCIMPSAFGRPNAPAVYFPHNGPEARPSWRSSALGALPAGRSSPRRRSARRGRDWSGFSAVRVGGSR